MNEKQTTLNRIYAFGKMLGKCTTQKDFAEKIGVHPTTISQALRGEEKYLTDKVMRLATLWAKAEGIEYEEGSAAVQAQPRPEQKPDIVIPAATAELYTAMAKSIDRLTALVERLQPGATAFQGAVYPGQKNYRIDGE